IECNYGRTEARSTNADRTAAVSGNTLQNETTAGSCLGPVFHRQFMRYFDGISVTSAKAGVTPRKQRDVGTRNGFSARIRHSAVALLNFMKLEFDLQIGQGTAIKALRPADPSLSVTRDESGHLEPWYGK